MNIKFINGKHFNASNGFRKIKRFLFLFILLSVQMSVYGQNPPFVPISEPSPFTEVRLSSAAWGDYDNDGDLDVLLAGTPDSVNGITRIYRNDGNDTFVSISAGLTGLFQGAVAWGDYDNDNDLDILLTGTTDGTTAISRVYRNDGGVFVDLNAGLTGVFQSSVAWGDYDNDGDLDILLSGTPDGAGGVSKIYRNDNGSFVEISAGLTGLYRSSVAWGDYDNDSDQDILLTGTEDGISRISKIYRNDGGSFVDIGAGLRGVSRSAVAWGDFDSDGDLDIALSGLEALLSRISIIYRNDGGNFVDNGDSLTGVSGGSLAWGDYDSDGDLDILLTGKPFLSPAVTKIYNNNGGIFTEIPAQLPDISQSSVAWGDYDNDNDLDILLAGAELTPVFLVPLSNVYKNILNVPNTTPASPSGLQANPVVSAVTLNWNKATDNQTPSNGLNYNLRLGTTPGGSEVVTPMAETASGFRKVPKFGNTNLDTAWTITGLAPGTYFWSVQTIDNGFAGSPFAGEQSFIINAPPVVVNPLPDTTIRVIDPPVVRDLELPPIVFSDPDGDPLSYSTQSLNPSVATASLTGSVLTVTPLTLGTAQIIVTANDNISGAVSDTFLVTVTSNLPPVVANPLPDTTIRVTDPPVVRDLESPPVVFSDPDGDPLSYSTQSLNPSVATASLTGSVLTVTPLTAGTAQIIVTANDNISGAISDTFVVTVTPENQPPMVVNPLPDTTLNVNNPPLVRDLEAAPIVFSDPDGDPLSYSTQSLTPTVATAVLNGSVLTVTPLSAGTSQVIVTADDNISGSVSDTFVVTVTPENQPPVVINPLPDTTLQVNAPPLVRDLESPPVVFSDPDGDPLSYSTQSSDPGVASASLNGSVLTVTSLTAGSTRVIVTANDNISGTVSDTFVVTITPENQPPVVVNPLPDTTLQVNDPPLVRDLEAPPVVFSDPDGDPLSYSTQSSDPGVASASLNGSVLTVTPLTAGSTRIIVTANDNISGTVSDTFLVSVTSENRPPVLTVISDQVVSEGDTLNVEVSAFDPDGDNITLITPNLPDFGSFTDNGDGTGTIIFTPQGSDTGEYVIEVVATDDGAPLLSDTTFFQLTINQPPVIDHTPVSLHDIRMEIPISARVTDDLGVAVVSLNYRKGGEGAYQQIPMTETGGVYQAIIPATDVTSRGVEYFILAEDITGLSAQAPSSGFYSVRVSIPEPGIVQSNLQPSGSNQAAYRLFSIPIDANNKHPDAVLGDDLGPYNETRWRFFELRPDQQYSEYPNTSEMFPGKAFWLIIRELAVFLDTGAGVTVSTSEAYQILLHPGWSFIGNPYNFNIPAGNIKYQNSEQMPVLRTFNGVWNNPLSEVITEIKPFEGYAVFNSSGSDEILLVDPNLSSGSNQLPKLVSTNDIENLSWFIRILAQCQEARDWDNLAGAAAAANSEWDVLDYAEPPVIGEFVSVYFSHPEWEKTTASYCTDIRPEPHDGEIWDFEVRTNIRDRVELTFEGVENVPAEFEVWLIDNSLNLSQNLREYPLYYVAGNGENSSKRLSLVIGKQGFVDETLEGFQAVPAAFELSQNFPNPFNPATTIRYGLPKEEIVTLKIYNMLGQEVAVLVNREKKASGYHQAIWDGRDKNGGQVASGVYVYQLRAETASLIKKMILLK